MFRSCLLFFLPFFIVYIFGFLEFFLSFGVKLSSSLIGSETMKKIVTKCDLLFFIGQKEVTGKEKILCLESAKLFFGYGPQLCFQIWILQAAAAPSFTQYISIAASFLLGTKSAYSLLSYSRENHLNALKSKGGMTSLKDKCLHHLKNLLQFLTWLPLIWTSFLLKIGSINLYIKFFGCYSVFMILLIFSLHSFAGFILAICAGATRSPSLSIWSAGLPEGSSFRPLNNLYISFTNIFVISRPFNTIRKIHLP